MTRGEASEASEASEAGGQRRVWRLSGGKERRGDRGRRGLAAKRWEAERRESRAWVGGVVGG